MTRVGRWIPVVLFLGCGTFAGPGAQLPSSVVLPPCPERTRLALADAGAVTLVWCETPSRRAHGWRASYWPDGRRAMRAEYRDGRPHGAMSTWHANGVRSRLSRWVDGRREGRSAEWYASGQLSSTVRYASGVKHGVQLDYYPSGHPMSRAVFRDGVQEGRLVAWYRTGVRQVEGDYHRGRAQGRWSYWDHGGRLDAVIHWRDGVEVPRPLESLTATRSRR